MNSNPLLPKDIIATSEQLKALLNSTSDIIYRMSPDWKEMLQLEGKGILTDTRISTSEWMKKYVHPLDHEILEVMMRKCIEQKTVFSLEHRMFKADGSIGWTFSRATPIFDNEGNLLEWLGLASDITDSRNILEHLKTSQEETERQKRVTQTIANSTPDLMYVFDLNYKFIYANTALLTMWGKSWEESIGKGLLENGYEPWHAEMHHREIDQVQKTKQQIRGEVSFPHAVLGKRIYDYIFTPIIDAEGNVEAIAGTTRDITEIKINEQRKNDFISMVSHELKTPLTALLGYLELMNLKMDADEVYLNRALQQSIKQTKKMTSLINGFLNLSSLESGKVFLSKVTFDMVEFLHEVEEETKSLYTTHQFVFETCPSIEVTADREKIAQVLSNLISNGVKYSVLGSTLYISCKQEGDMVYVQVKDEGMGISEAEIPKLFDRFYRVEADHLIAGFGIGLYLSKEIINNHGGEINATSKLGSGSEFWFSLPIV